MMPSKSRWWMQLFRHIHKVFGLLLSVLFLMWFLSGIVMIYHSFPKVSSADRLSKQENLPGDLPAIQSVFASLGDSARLSALSIEMNIDKAVFKLQGDKTPAMIWAQSLEEVGETSYSDIERIAKQWCSSPVAKVDTIRKPDQWIPFGRLMSEMPVYRFMFDDKERHEIYISSKTGMVLQETDKDSRLWAYLGAIPHWVYFTQLRQHQEAWVTFITWSSGIGCLMCIAGLIYGFHIMLKRKNLRITTHYKKRLYIWHYVTGLLFGLFALTFAFSGLMSLTDLPGWLKKKPAVGQQTSSRPARQRNTPINTTAYLLDYRRLSDSIEDVKRIEWRSYEGKPYYTVSTGVNTLHIDAADSTAVKPFRLTSDMIAGEIERTYGNDIAYTLELIYHHDDYYYPAKKRSAPLPVYRAVIADGIHTRIYYDPGTLTRRQSDDNSRVKYWLYQGLHALEFKYLTDRPWLWNIVMFTLLGGGTVLSATGVILTLKWLKRKIKNSFHPHKKKTNEL